MNLRSVHGAESVSIASARATAEITLTGAHIAPVTFVLDDREVQPYSLPPWQPQDFPDTEIVRIEKGPEEYGNFLIPSLFLCSVYTLIKTYIHFEKCILY